MIRDHRRAAVVVPALLAPWLLGSDCTPIAPEEPRVFRVSFVDSGDPEHIWRSHEAPEFQDWDGLGQIDLQVTAAEQVEARVFPPEGEALPDPTVVFLDAPDDLADVTIPVSSVRLGDGGHSVIERVLQGTYDVTIAPGVFQSGAPIARFEDVPLGEDSDGWEWPLPETELVVGDVTRTGQGYAGAMIVPYDQNHGGLPLGAWGESIEASESTSEGAFALEVPASRYDVVVSPQVRIQNSGTLQPDPIAPVHLDDRLWPIEPVLVPPLRERVELPPLPITRVNGEVRSGDVRVFARLRVEGEIENNDVLDYPGGRWIADLVTDATGAFLVDVPQGDYTITAIPPVSAKSMDVGVVSFSATGGETITLEIPLSVAPLASIRVLDPIGRPVPDADLYLRRREPPRYVYGARTQSTDDSAPGSWVDLLMRGTYDVEVVPPPTDESPPAKQWARAHGVLEVGGDAEPLVIALRPSARVDGLAFSLGEVGAEDVLVRVHDPLTGKLVDEAVTNRNTQPGFFRLQIPESEGAPEEADDEN